MENELNDRQRDILQYVVYDFVRTAVPVGSRAISKHHKLGLSPATIRNTMADLEELGFVTHPHTSAGRMPTDKGYRFFVDRLMEVEPLGANDQDVIRKQFDVSHEPAELLRQAAKLLGLISHQLSVVSSPHIRASTLDHLELVWISSSKVLIVLSVKSGIVRTITLEVASDISQDNLYGIAHLLNERLHGLTLEEIRLSFADRLRDYKNERTGLVDLFIKSADSIFDDQLEWEKLHIGGTQSLAEQPEYENPENFRAIIGLLNDEGVLIEVLEKPESRTPEHHVAISIGEEHADQKMKNYSLLVSEYHAAGSTGKIGIIGPKRMHYAKIIPIVNFVADEITTALS